MDRLEFVERFKYKEEMPISFNELMSLFNVVDMYVPNSSQLPIHLSKSKNLSLDFTLPSTESAIILKGTLDRVELVNYDNKYVVETTLDQKTINLRLNRVSG